jgi:aspartyl-tRNA(Asn)/glutamyl-tRNA(Gln) amidotransferase subunit A
VKGLRLLLPKTVVREGLDREVEEAFQSSIERLKSSGALVIEKPIPVFDRQSEYFKGGGYAGAEAYAIHRKNAARLSEYDPRVAKRVMLGKDLSAADYVDFGLLRAAFQHEVGAALEAFDACVLPSVPCIAPPIAEVDASDEAYFRWNTRILGIVGLVNFLDGCAASLPCHARAPLSAQAPVGLMVFGPAMSDRRILAVAAAIERALATA